MSPHKRGPHKKKKKLFVPVIPGLNFNFTYVKMKGPNKCSSTSNMTSVGYPRDNFKNFVPGRIITGQLGYPRSNFKKQN